MKMSGHEFKDLIEQITEIVVKMYDIGYELWGDKPSSKKKEIDIHSLFEPILRILEK